MNSEGSVTPTVESDIVEDASSAPEEFCDLDGTSTDLPDLSSPPVVKDLSSQSNVVDRPRRAIKPNPKYDSETYVLSY